jgi:hypothetical protein
MPQADDDARQDLFRSVVSDLGDGQKWKLIRTDGWDQFVRQLAHTIEELPLRRRQALLMMLFAMSDGNLSPEEIAAYLEGRDMEADDEVESLVDWLRRFRPREP